MKVVYIAHPVSGNVTENLAKAKQWVRWAAVVAGVSPVANWIPMCEVMDDADPEMRVLGLSCDKAVIRRCHELWLCGPVISQGMRAEAVEAEQAGIPIRWFDWEYPPVGPVDYFDQVTALAAWEKYWLDQQIAEITQLAGGAHAEA